MKSKIQMEEWQKSLFRKGLGIWKSNYFRLSKHLGTSQLNSICRNTKQRSKRSWTRWKCLLKNLLKTKNHSNQSKSPSHIEMTSSWKHTKPYLLTNLLQRQGKNLWINNASQSNVAPNSVVLIRSGSPALLILVSRMLISLILFNSWS